MGNELTVEKIDNNTIKCNISAKFAKENGITPQNLISREYVYFNELLSTFIEEAVNTLNFTVCDLVEYEIYEEEDAISVVIYSYPINDFIQDLFDYVNVTDEFTDVCVINFESLDDIVSNAKNFNNMFDGLSDMYVNDGYNLIIYKPEDMDNEKFKLICYSIGEYGKLCPVSKAFLASLKEHATHSIKNDALKQLAQI